MASHESLHALRTTQTASFVSLLTSSGTLVCCALPALLVTIGAGAALSGLIAAVPQLVWFSENKAWVFGLAAVMLVLSGIMQWRARRMPCPADPALAQRCQRTRRFSARVWWVSVILIAVGAFFAFVAPALQGP
jgi:hypothetical protein